jgi:hypothetical protein
MSVVFRTSLLQVLAVVKKQKIVYVKITCGLGINVSEEYTACIFRRLSEDGDSIRLSIPNVGGAMWWSKLLNTQSFSKNQLNILVLQCKTHQI